MSSATTTGSCAWRSDLSGWSPVRESHTTGRESHTTGRESDATGRESDIGRFSGVGAAGIVLVGGRSSRMGRSKAWLDWGGVPLLNHVVGVVRVAVEGPVVVVGAPGQELPPVDAEVVADPVEGCGPLQGIATGLAALQGRAEVAFVASVDLPLLHPAYVRRVLALLGAHEVLLPVVHGHHQPLAAAYRTSLAPVVVGLLGAGRSRPPDLFATVDVHRAGAAELLADPTLAQADPELRSLVNVNTPEEYAAAVEQT